MSKEQLVEMANSDTPNGVDFPSNWPGILAWVLGRFGLGVGVAIVFGWFTVRVYEDLQRQNDRILDAFRQQHRAMPNTSMPSANWQNESRRLIGGRTKGFDSSRRHVIRGRDRVLVG
jgi:hypothetical protein